ncbi:multicopper oxidase domain-containing protein [Microbacterium laevaniformans]|uniref:multicopper oxidase domain-containing protein n=1 Tax=Microbacterium laevaniformans TaxID=36807 RepID=UPI0031E71FC8
MRVRHPASGHYWFHPHVGPQLDHGLYGALIIDDPDEKVTWDDEWVLILDDWLDGVTATPTRSSPTSRRAWEAWAGWATCSCGWGTG